MAEEPLTRLESNWSHMKSDIQDMKADIRSVTGLVQHLGTELHAFKTDVTKEFGAVRGEMAKEFGAVRGEIGQLKSEMATEFGKINTTMASLRTQIVQSKLWMLTTGVATVLSVAAVVGLKVH